MLRKPSCFATASITATAMLFASAAPAQADAPILVDAAADFTDISGYQPIDTAGFSDPIHDGFEWDGTPPITPMGTISPQVMAILAVEAHEEPVERARYRLKLGLGGVGGHPPGRVTQMTFIQIDRFNLGPAIREELIETHGAEHAPPAGVFGDGPHVSYRFAMSPVQGTPASINSISRMEMPDAKAASVDCFDTSCLTTDTVIEDAVSWGNERDASIDFDQPYGVRRGGVISPAAAMDMLALQQGIASIHDGRLWPGQVEPRESVGFAEPFVETIIEINLGQDEVVDAAIHDTHLMDHMTEAFWRRVVAVSMGPGQEPLLVTAEVAEARTQPDMATSSEPSVDGLTSAPPREPGTSIDAIVPAEALNMPAYRPDGAHMPPVATSELVDCGAIDQSTPGGIIVFPNDRGRNWTDAGMGPVTVGFVGCSNTFEANIQYEAYHGDDEEPTIEGSAMGGAYGDWGMFEFEERFWTAGDWTVEVFEYNVASGHRLDYDSVTFSVDR
ncbi:hypothetical protein [Fodinicurvata sp. EGI_FJ10296]|uniref:hypothetical protein n=1 Tax=Fodinicurvata sp. EGI_FJ10296 TaxID=3231908 RepID=UPI0034558357